MKKRHETSGEEDTSCTFIEAIYNLQAIKKEKKKKNELNTEFD